jgi:hypothetical protein
MLFIYGFKEEAIAQVIDVVAVILLAVKRVRDYRVKWPAVRWSRNTLAKAVFLTQENMCYTCRA